MVIRPKPDCEDVLRTRHSEITPGNFYRVLTVSNEDYRILADDGRPSLYPRHLFDVISDWRPDDWIVEKDSEGNGAYEGPAFFAAPGFWESCFDDEPAALRVLRRRLMQWANGEDFFVNRGP